MSQIFLSVDPQALSCLQKTLNSLFENSTGAKSIVVIGTSVNELDIRRIADSEISSGITFEFVLSETSEHLSLALGMAERSGGEGVLFVKSGVTVPYAWDARLERIARHNPKIGTVSPLCDSSAMFALLGNEGRAKVTAGDMQYVDALTFSLSSRTYIEVPCFLDDCFYISRAALELAAAKADKGHPDSQCSWSYARLLSSHGFLNVLGDCLYVYSELQTEIDRTKYFFAQNSVQSIIRAHPFKRLGLKVLQGFSGNITYENRPGLDCRPVQLHVQHSWGGGLEKWVRNYCAADKSRVNLILKSMGREGVFGERLVLYSGIDDAVPLQTWEFLFPIQGTVVSHLDYANAIDEIIRRYSVDTIFVSSLIGHSLDILNTSKQTILICHDYYPYCPALNITFGSLCTNCEFPRLDQCFKENIHNRHFRTVGATDWEILREKYISSVQSNHLKIVIPNQSIKDNLVRLESRFNNVDFELIPHGILPMPQVERVPASGKNSGGKLRVLVLGRLAPDKGLSILKEIADELVSFAELFLVGCGDGGKFFEKKRLGGIIYSYTLNELPQIIHDIDPDIALLLSVVPETFSYSLSELTELRVPVVATKLGSFAERIEDGKTGFLVTPNAEDVIRTIKVLDADRTQITRVKESLAQAGSKSVAEMVSDYHRILPLANLPIARFPVKPHFESLNLPVSDQRYQELLQKENELTQLTSSRSWRLTASLRWVNNLIAHLSGRNG
jgi:glycosyltransferase involved in cell wall biosynthesis